MSIAVICTLGPACRDVETLVELLEAGMTAARIDLTVSLAPSICPSAALARPDGPHTCALPPCLCHTGLYASEALWADTGIYPILSACNSSAGLLWGMQLQLSETEQAAGGGMKAECHVQWGSVDYHKQSLRNLQKASQQTRRMCAVILDIVGRELMIRRDFTLDHEVRRLLSPNAMMPETARHSQCLAHICWPSFQKRDRVSADLVADLISIYCLG